MAERPAEPKALSAEREPHEIFELADEEQIVAELQGRVTERFVYELPLKDPQTGKNVVGLSYAGTNWACREYARQGEVIRIVGKPDYQPDPTDDNYVIITVMAQRFAVHPDTGKEIPLDTAPGVKRQWRKMKKNVYQNGQKVDEEIVDDPFFWEKGLSKACRNAKQALIPTDIVKTLIAKALELKRAGPPTGDGAGRAGQKPQGTPKAAPGRPAASPPPESAAPSTGASQTPPAAAKPTSGSSAPPPPTPAPAAGPADKPTLIQQIDAVIKKAYKTSDTAAARREFKKLVGTDKLGDLPEETIRKVGKLLQGYIKGQHKLSPDGTKILDASGTVLWPETPPEPQPEEEEEETPAATGASSETDDEFNF
jgi:hypothetical protein